MIDGDRIRAIKALLAEVRPGPWQWIGNTKMREVSLATVRDGHIYVMDFVRWGMHGAQPRFQVALDSNPHSGVMRSLDDLTTGGGGLGVKYEAPHRKHFAGIAHPDARFLAESRSLVDELLTEVERLHAAWERVGGVLSSEGCDCDHDHEPGDEVTEDCGPLRRVEAAWRGAATIAEVR